LPWRPCKNDVHAAIGAPNPQFQIQRRCIADGNCIKALLARCHWFALYDVRGCWSARAATSSSTGTLQELCETVLGVDGYRLVAKCAVFLAHLANKRL
jgi:hypothetical protein